MEFGRDLYFQRKDAEFFIEHEIHEKNEKITFILCFPCSEKY